MRDMLSGEKILVTGPAGNIGFALTKSLARDNEVWGVARFSSKDRRKALDEAGVITREIDLYEADFSSLPKDFTYLVHIAVAHEPNYDRAFRINGEGTGFLMEHCRGAKAALVMSTCTVYRPHPDPFYPYKEEDPLGDQMPIVPTYSVAKISEEVVARYCARAFNLPTVIARMNAAYGPNGGLEASHADAIVAGRPVVTRNENCAYSPIHDDDIFAQLGPLLSVASVPATIVNWGGDEVVTVKQWTAYMGELLGLPTQIKIEPIKGASGGSVADPQKRRSITGPSKVHWKDGFRRMLAEKFPDRVLKA
jgi:nucleoside-diphosphate-sugar epimerase